jgi:pimeloyl-ACP methyl ester carboxylesterase
MNRQTDPLANGPIQTSIKNQRGDLELYTYVPKTRSAGGLLFLFDGVRRDAPAICTKAIPVAEQTGFSLVAPLMTERAFPKWRYQHAGIVRDNILQPKTEWTFNYIQYMIDYMLEQSPHKVEKVILFGHSAGAQLLSRICAYSPLSDVDTLIIANPSSYVMPVLEEPIPFGFQQISPEKRAKSAIKDYLSAPMTIYLGRQDVEDLYLSQSIGAMRQGKNRLQRGRKVFQTGEQLARKHQLEFNWQLVELADVGHSSRDMLNSETFKEMLLNS